jgi:hypothetical protein
MSQLILSNPLIRRYRFSLLRPSSLWIYLSIYVSVIVLLLFINDLSVWVTDQVVLSEKLYRRLYTQFLVIQAIILWVWATFNSGSALRDEHLNKTYDFFRLLPMSALQKVCGILLGKNLLALLLAAIGFVPLILFGGLAGVDPSIQVQIVFLLLSVALCVSSAFLLSSAMQTRWKAGTRPTVLIFVGVLVVPFLLSPLFMFFGAVSRGNTIGGQQVAFYGLEVPAILFAALLALYVGIWCILGVIRKFRLEEEPLFSPIAAILFLCGYEIIAIGLFLPHLPDQHSPAYALWMLVSLIPVVLVPRGALRTFNAYLESSGPLGPVAGSPGTALFTLSNLTLSVSLFAVWVVFSGFFVVAARVSLPQFGLDALTIFSFCLVLMLLSELHIVYVPVYSKIGLFVGFLAAAYLGLPLIVSAVLQTSNLYFYSFFGFIGYLFQSWEEPDAITNTSVFIFNSILCIVPALLVWRRYARILAMRKQMTQPGLQAVV